MLLRRLVSGLADEEGGEQGRAVVPPRVGQEPHCLLLLQAPIPTPLPTQSRQPCLPWRASTSCAAN